MAVEVRAIGMGGVNCYLLREQGGRGGADGFVLVDTGTPGKRARLRSELERAGCVPGGLGLIVLTHGDYDHAGNAAAMRSEYGAEVAMHRADARRVVSGDWDLGMKPEPDKSGRLIRLVSRFYKPRGYEAFTPDVYLDDGQSLAGRGCEATVLYLPGHTSGSIGVLTADGDLLCGDLLYNWRRPGLHFFINDMDEATDSLERLRGLGVRTVYPGHGKPFSLDRVADPR